IRIGQVREVECMGARLQVWRLGFKVLKVGAKGFMKLDELNGARRVRIDLGDSVGVIGRVGCFLKTGQNNGQSTNSPSNASATKCRKCRSHRLLSSLFRI